MEKNYYFSLSISYTKFQNYYSGIASKVVVETNTGLKIQLAAAKLRPFLLQNGIYGRFHLVIDEKNKFKSLSKY